MDKMEQLIQEVLTESDRLARLAQPADYETYVELTELREALAAEVHERSAISEVERALLGSISQYDEIILGHMQTLMQEAAAGIQRINSSKKQKAGYGNAGSHESIMFDKGV
ncbi:hypothetical protein [Cohnella cellulosilytica]|uniref:Flagellar protein FliT n=1 Tax=Cohnella cellulosilytica TaxID=986710 RepID=A0ABW2FN33_9BACL